MLSKTILACPLAILVFIGLFIPKLPSSANQGKLVDIRQSSSLPLKLSLKFNAPNRGAPQATTGGAVRGACLPAGKDVVPLQPKGKFELTLAEYPSFFFYLPQSNNLDAQLVVLGDNDTKVVYQAALAFPTSSGIARVDLPKSAPPLQIGKQYHWYISMNCDQASDGGSVVIEGWIERTQPTPALTSALAKATPIERPELYAEAGLWNDSLTSLVMLRQTNPGNARVLSNWSALLKTAGLDALINQPLLN